MRDNFTVAPLIKYLVIFWISIWRLVTDIHIMILEIYDVKRTVNTSMDKVIYDALLKNEIIQVSMVSVTF